MFELDILHKNVFQKVFEEQLKFMTSADVIMKACGLRQETICAIARKHGVEIDDVSSKCIDEELLSLLADAHVRQMKSYFHNAKHHLSELIGEELSTFLGFCDVFNRPYVSGVPMSWNDIDADAVREQFIRKVHELTGCRGIFGALICGDDLKGLWEAILAAKNKNGKEVLRLFLQDCIIECVTRSRWLYVPKVRTVSYSTCHNAAVRMVTLTARYYIFPEEDSHIA